MAATTTVSYTREFNNCKLDDFSKYKEAVPVLVQVNLGGNNGSFTKSGHEVLYFRVNSDYNTVCSEIYNRFKEIQASDATSRSNMNTFWSPDHEIRKIVVSWAGSNPVEWSGEADGISKTTLTPENARPTLQMLCRRNALDTMIVFLN